MAKGKHVPAPVYLDARRTWNERYGDYIQQRDRFGLIAILAIGVAGVSVAGNVYQASQSKVVPYVVQVDKLQTVMPVGPADRAARADPRIVRAELANLIVDLRSVYGDAAASRQSIIRAYNRIDRKGPAFVLVNEFMMANDPFKRAQTELVSVKVDSVLHQAGDVWRVEWTETVRDRSGSIVSARPWSALITTKIIPPTTEAGLLTNPLGVYATDLSWSARIQ